MGNSLDIARYQLRIWVIKLVKVHLVFETEINSVSTGSIDFFHTDES